MPEYGRSSTRGLATVKTPMMELPRHSAHLEQSKVRYPQSYQNGQRVATSAPSKVMNSHAHFHQRQPVSPRGNTPTSIHHTANSAHPTLSAQYLPTSQAPEFFRAQQSANMRFHLAQHVNTRRNSTGGLRRYFENSATTNQVVSPVENSYAGKPCGLRELSRQFHQDVWQENSEMLKAKIDYPFMEENAGQAPENSHVRTSPSFGPRLRSPSMPGNLSRQSSVSPRDPTSRGFYREGAWNPLSASPRSPDDVFTYYESLPPSAENTQGSIGCSGDTLKHGYAQLCTRDKLGHEDTHLYSRDKLGHEEVQSYTRDRLGSENARLRKNRSSVDVPKSKMTKSSTVVVISDSEDENSVESCVELASSPELPEDNMNSDVFPAVHVIENENEGDARTCSPNKEVEPDILLGGLISPRLKIKSEHVPSEEPLSTNDCVKRVKRERTSESDSFCYASKAGGESSYRSVLCEREMSGHSDGKERVVLSEQVFCDWQDKRTKGKAVVKHESRVAGCSELGQCNSNCAANNCPLTNHKDVGKNRGSKVQMYTDENLNVCFWSQECDVKREGNVNTACQKNGKNQPESHVSRSEKSTTGYESDPSERRSCSEYNEHASDISKEGVKKEPEDISEHNSIESPRDGSLSPTFEPNFPLGGWSELGDDEIKPQSESEPAVQTDTSTFRGDTDKPKPLCERSVEQTNAFDKYGANFLQSVEKDHPDLKTGENKLHCQSCDRLLSKKEEKTSDVTSTKSAKKPTGIVVGVKQERCIKEPLISNTAEVDELAKHDGRETKENGRDEHITEKTTAEGEIKKGFSLLQFSVVEKDPGATWGNKDERAKYSSGSRGQAITSQQWEAYSVKLETGTTRKQLGLVPAVPLRGAERITGAPKLHRLEPKSREQPDDVSNETAGYVREELGPRKLEESEFVEQNALKKMRESHQKGVARAAEGAGWVAVKISDEPKSVPKNGNDKLCGSELTILQSMIAKNIYISSRGKKSGDVTRKRRIPDVSENCREADNERTRFSENGTHLSESSKRRKFSEENSGDVGELVRKDCATYCNTDRLKTVRQGSSEAGLGTSDEFASNHKVISNTNDSQIPARHEVLDTRAENIKAKGNDILTSDQRCAAPVGGNSSEVKSPERKEVLTTDQWKEILLGRIEQVKESIASEQTPWKTKNKRKVLEKLENQLKWWDAPINDPTFISRRLQFFQTMRNQYELMKRVGAQRSASKNLVATVQLEKLVTDDSPPKEKILNLIHVSEKKKNPKQMKKIVNSSSSPKKGRLALKKFRNVAL